jgi:hypothetical protein
MSQENPLTEKRSSDRAELVDIFESEPAADHSDYVGLVVILTAVVGSAALIMLLGLVIH